MEGAVAVLTAFAQGCAMCRTALESSPEGRLLAGSFAQGILMLMFLPYIIFGTIAFAIYRAYRKKERRAADDADFRS
jgi:hypothetical protein